MPLWKGGLVKLYVHVFLIYYTTLEIDAPLFYSKIFQTSDGVGKRKCLLHVDNLVV